MICIDMSVSRKPSDESKYLQLQRIYLLALAVWHYSYRYSRDFYKLKYSPWRKISSLLHKEINKYFLWKYFFRNLGLHT